MMIPHRTPFFLPWLYPTLMWRGASDQKVLYLTFDDGPVPGPTQFVLQQLKAYNAQATFFCIGDNIRKHPEVFLEVIEAGHQVANHTFNHMNGWKTTHDTYIDNVNRCHDEMQKYGVTASLFRPPYGRITRKQIKTLTNYKIIMWDVLSKDYSKTINPERCLSQTINVIRPGSVVVFHDSVKAEKNMAYVLPRLLDHFRQQGFSFASL